MIRVVIALFCASCCPSLQDLSTEREQVIQLVYRQPFFRFVDDNMQLQHSLGLCVYELQQLRACEADVLRGREHHVSAARRAGRA